MLEKAHGHRQGKGLLWHQCSLALKGTRSGYAQHVLGHCHVTAACDPGGKAQATNRM